MVITYNQEINPIRSILWLPFQDIKTVNGLTVTTNYGFQSGIKNVQLGDGTTSSTFPSFASGNKGFYFDLSSYITSPLSLGTEFSICANVRPYMLEMRTDQYLCAFSNGGGIILNDSSSSNQLTYYDGTTTISSTIELSDNRFYTIGVSKDSANNVNIYVNGILKASGVGTESNVSLSYIACDNSLSNRLWGEVKEFCCFDNELVLSQFATLNTRLLKTVGGQKVITDPIADAVNKYGGFWLDPDVYDALTLNTQPADISSLGSAAFVPSNPAIVFSDDAEMPAGVSGLSIKATISDGAMRWGSRGAMIVGNRYRGSCWLKSDGAESVQMCDGNVTTLAGEVISSNWTLDSDEITSTSATLLLLRSANIALPGTAYFRPISLSNLSITTLNPRLTSTAFAGLTFTQATAANMPWKNSTLWNGKQAVGNGIGDTMRGDAGHALFEGENTAWTVFHVAKQKTLDPAGNRYFWGANGGTSSVHAGIISGGGLVVTRENGGGFVQYLGGTRTLDLSVYCWRFNGTTLDIVRNGTSIVSGFAFALAGAITPDAYQINGTLKGTTYSGDIDFGDHIAFSGVLTDAEITAIGKALAAKWGGTWT